MKITVIGYWGGYPAAGSATSSYLVEKNDYTLLVDCGSGSLSRLQQFKKVTDLDAVILSHYHHDHIADLGVLQYAWLVQNNLEQTENILPIYGHSEDGAFSKLSHQYTNGMAYHPGETLQLGPLSINFLKTDHPVPCYGMRICDGTDVFVYTADTSYNNEWVQFAKGADLLVTDTNFYKGMDGSGPGHMTSEEAATIANKANVDTLWLSHLPHFGQHTRLKQEAEDVFHGTIQLATEGLTWGEDS
ncbi:MBL fold metallo-hydrolase [Halobacillus shinanisalinarum]|uniref:MBL fold metallo-hydrolase n=1 Tax=Halobacillus shinanisalinarum TaxID=2932258 RepID=A0ABY4GXH4_9BACI|nr:MBL fold metallo-hydrolase [Halobacillus shinanisalinarum]UOQ92783.1 MBL fold metallo-hydrolase [Halobacillus shinanisalinarum]